MNFMSKFTVAAVFAMILALPVAAEERVATISVAGTGTVDVAPDMAVISFGVLREGKTAREALDKNNTAMTEILSSLKEAGVEDKDLQTSNFNIQPRYQYYNRSSNGEQKPPKIVGYTVSNNLTIRVRDLEISGEILDLVVTLGVNTGGNIHFTNANKKEIMKQARIAAVKDAMEKAKVLTETAGAGLGDIVTISENFNSPRPVPFAKAARMEAAVADAAVPIAAGENSYRATVQITWEIDQ